MPSQDTPAREREVSEPSPGAANCHGYSFNRDETFIEPAEVGPLILKDNYTEIMVASCAKAAICDVIIYGDKGADGTFTVDHSGFVIELDANGKPALVVSKWGDGAGVFVHKPQHYKTATTRTDYRVRRRRGPAEVPDEVAKLEQEYKDAVEAKKDQKPRTRWRSSSARRATRSRASRPSEFPCSARTA